MKNSLVSIVTINFNDAAGLQRTIESVFNQSYEFIEYIVIDGGSTDVSVEVIKKNSDRITHWVSEKDKGVYDAMNRGIAVCKGEYLLFLNSGDYFASAGALSEIITKRGVSDADVYYWNVNLYKNGLPQGLQSYPEKLDLDFWRRTSLNHQSTLIRRELFTTFGLYNTIYNFSADYEWFLKVFYAGSTFQYLNAAVVNYDVDGISTSDFDLLVAEREHAWRHTIPAFIDDLYESEKMLRKREQSRTIKIAFRLQALYNKHVRSGV